MVVNLVLTLSSMVSSGFFFSSLAFLSFFFLLSFLSFSAPSAASDSDALAADEDEELEEDSGVSRGGVFSADWISASSVEEPPKRFFNLPKARSLVHEMQEKREGGD